MAKKEEEKIDIFGSAKVKIKGSKPKDDKEVIYIDGLEPKLLELEFLKAQIKDLEAQLGGVADEIKNISKEKFVELYKRNKSNPNTFLIKDGEGCVMVIPTDRYISIKDEDRVNQLIEEYGDDIITTDGQWVFNSEVLKRNIDAIKQLLMDAKNISNEDKKNLLVNEKSYSISKGYIDKLAQYGSKIGTVLDDIQPVINLKNCGGKMEEGGMMGDDFIGNVYGEGSVVFGDGMTSESYGTNNNEIIIKAIQEWNDITDDENKIGINSKERTIIINQFKNKNNYTIDDVLDWIQNDLEFNYEGGGFLGGIFGGGRTYKKGLAYKLDRAKHNKSEDWEVPMKNRKKRYEDGDMVDAVGDLYFISDDGYEVYIKESDYQKEALSYFKKPLTQQEVKKLGTSKYNAFIHHLSKKGYDKKYASGGGVGNIPNNYEGKSPKDIWDSWSKEQRKHFLYDHQSDARDSDEVGGSKGYYYSDDIDKWVEMEWNELPYAMIKNLVFEHTDSGQYAKGGGLKNKVGNKYAKGSTVKGSVSKAKGNFYIVLDDLSAKWFSAEKVEDVPNVYFAVGRDNIAKGQPFVQYENALRVLYNKHSNHAMPMPKYAGLEGSEVKLKFAKGSTVLMKNGGGVELSPRQGGYKHNIGDGVEVWKIGGKSKLGTIIGFEEDGTYIISYEDGTKSYTPKKYIANASGEFPLMANGGGVEILYDVISYDDNDRIVDSYYGVSEQEADEIKKSLEETYESAGVDNYVYVKTSNIKTSKEATEKYNKSVRDLYQRRRFESGQEDDDYANGGGVESVMTDEMCVMQSCVNGEIHCDMLEEIIGSKPEYPYQQVGSIRLKKCYLRPYYKIS